MDVAFYVNKFLFLKQILSNVGFISCAYNSYSKWEPLPYEVKLNVDGSYSNEGS